MSLILPVASSPWSSATWLTRGRLSHARHTQCSMSIFQSYHLRDEPSMGKITFLEYINNQFQYSHEIKEWFSPRNVIFQVDRTFRLRRARPYSCF